LSESESCEIDDLINIYTALIRFHFKEDPELLTDDEFASRVKELKWLAEEGVLTGGKTQKK
jgi:hypothetical protein